MDIDPAYKQSSKRSVRNFRRRCTIFVLNL